jgi:hypothetical protein
MLWHNIVSDSVILRAFFYSRWTDAHQEPGNISASIHLFSFQAESKRRAAQEDARINRERADLKRAEAERLKLAEKMNAGHDLVSETGFWNLGATSEKVRPGSQLCCITVGWSLGVGHTGPVRYLLGLVRVRIAWRTTCHQC